MAASSHPPGAGHEPPELTILDKVRERCRAVAEQATLVRIQPDRIAAYAAEIAEVAEVAATLATSEAPVDPDPWLVTDTDGSAGAEPTVALVLALATVNFGSGYHPVVRKRPGCSGAVTMATGLREWATRASITAEALARFSPDQAHEVFDQPHDAGPVDELMGLFTMALNDLGNLVLDEYAGSFLALVGDAEGSAARLVERLGRLPFYADVATYRGLRVPFYKRAQLAAADLDRVFAGTGPGRFDDLDRLTAFADNLVPHVLRVDGVLTYDPDLAASIDREELLVPGSEAEVEIRAGGVHGVELIGQALADQGRLVRSSDLDMLLWRRGGGPTYKAIPRHRARTPFY